MERIVIYLLLNGIETNKFKAKNSEINAAP